MIHLTSPELEISTDFQRIPLKKIERQSRNCKKILADMCICERYVSKYTKSSYKSEQEPLRKGLGHERKDA